MGAIWADRLHWETVLSATLMTEAPRSGVIPCALVPFQG